MTPAADAAPARRFASGIHTAPIVLAEAGHPGLGAAFHPPALPPVVRIVPNADACLRLVTALCAEQSEEWISGRRYLDVIDMTATLEISNVTETCR